MMPTATKGKRPLRHLTATDKIIAIQRIHDGESKASVARDIGVPESTLRGWCKNEEKLRYMSQQAQEQKPSADKLMDKIVSEAAMAAVAAAELLNGPPEKRPKLNSSLPMGYNGKIKSDYGYKRNSLNGMDLSNPHNSPLNGDSYSYSSFAKAASSYSALQNKAKDYKGYDLSVKQEQEQNKADLSMAAISPLTSLSHLSGMGALNQSPLALSFNDIANNLNLLAQLQSNANPMSGIQSLGSPQGQGSQSGQRSGGRPKSNPNNCHSPRSDIDKASQQSLTVKNLAKMQQKSPQSMSMEHIMGMSDKNKPNGKINGTQSPAGSGQADDALWYWLKSQQTMMRINNLYSSLPRSTSPVSRSQQSSLPNGPSSPTQAQSIPPMSSPAQSTPTSNYNLPGSSLMPPTMPNMDDPKSLATSSWLWQWYKTFGSQLSKGEGLNPQQILQNQQMLLQSLNNNNLKTHPNYPSPNGSKGTSPYNNILFSQLTKNTDPNSVKSEPEDLSHSHHQLFNDNPNEGNRHSSDEIDSDRKSEHLELENHHVNLPRSASSSRTPSPNTKTTPNVMEMMNPNANTSTPIINDLLKPISTTIPSSSDGAMSSSTHSSSTNSTTIMTDAPHSPNTSSPRFKDTRNEDSNDSNSNHHNPHKSPTKVRAVLDNFLYNNGNNSCTQARDDPTSDEANNNDNYNNNNMDVKNNNVQISSPVEALEYGEKFLKWLESCSDPSITAVQVMQYRYLLQCVKASANRALILANNNNNNHQFANGYNVDNSPDYRGEENNGYVGKQDQMVVEERTKVRRRK